MPLWAEAVAALMALTGVGGIVSGVLSARRRAGLYEGLAPFEPTIGDQAEAWLRRQNIEAD